MPLAGRLDRPRDTRGIACVVTLDRVVREREIGRMARTGRHVIEARRVGIGAAARDAAVGRLQREHAAQRRRNTHAAGRVETQRDRDMSGGDGGRRTT